MLHIDIKTAQALTTEEKINLTQKLSAAFADCSDPHVAGNIQYTVTECSSTSAGTTRFPLRISKCIPAH